MPPVFPLAVIETLETIISAIDIIDEDSLCIPPHVVIEVLENMATAIDFLHSQNTMLPPFPFDLVENINEIILDLEGLIQIVIACPPRTSL